MHVLIKAVFVWLTKMPGKGVAHVEIAESGGISLLGVVLP